MIKVVKAGGECKVDVDYDGYVWTINHKPDWVNIDERDEYFNITVMPNTTGQDRQGTITVQSGKRLAQVAIGQLGICHKAENRRIQSELLIVGRQPEAQTGHRRMCTAEGLPRLDKRGRREGRHIEHNMRRERRRIPHRNNSSQRGQRVAVCICSAGRNLQCLPRRGR